MLEDADFPPSPTSVYTTTYLSSNGGDTMDVRSLQRQTISQLERLIVVCQEQLDALKQECEQACQRLAISQQQQQKQEEELARLKQSTTSSAPALSSITDSRISALLRADLLLISIFNSRIAVERHKIELLSATVSKTETGEYDHSGTSVGGIGTLIGNVTDELDNDQNILLLKETMQEAEAELMQLQQYNTVSLPKGSARSFRFSRRYSRRAPSNVISPLRKSKKIDGQVTMQLMSQLVRAPQSQPSLEVLKRSLKDISTLDAQTIHCFVSRFFCFVSILQEQRMKEREKMHQKSKPKEKPKKKGKKAKNSDAADVDETANDAENAGDEEIGVTIDNWQPTGSDLRIFNASHKKICSFQHTKLFWDISPLDVAGFIALLVDYLCETRSPSVTSQAALVCLDQLIYPQIHDACIDLVRVRDEDQLFASQCSRFSNVSQQALGIDKDLIDTSMIPWSTAISKLRTLPLCQSPLKILFCVLSATEAVFSLGESLLKRPLSADDFFPIFVYVVIHAHPPNLPTALRYVDRFAHKDVLLAELGYSFSNLWAACEFIKVLTNEQLTQTAGDIVTKTILTPNTQHYNLMLSRMKVPLVEISEETVDLEGYRVVAIREWLFSPAHPNCTFLIPSDDPTSVVTVGTIQCATDAQTGMQVSTEGFQFLWDKHFSKESLEFSEIQELTLANTIPPTKGWCAVISDVADIPNEFTSIEIDGANFEEEMHMLKIHVTLQRLLCCAPPKEINQDQIKEALLRVSQTYVNSSNNSTNCACITETLHYLRTLLVLVACLPSILSPLKASGLTESCLRATSTPIRKQTTQSTTTQLTAPTPLLAPPTTKESRSISTDSLSPLVGLRACVLDELSFYDDVVRAALQNFQKTHNQRLVTKLRDSTATTQNSPFVAKARDSIEEGMVTILQPTQATMIPLLREDGLLSPGVLGEIEGFLVSVWARVKMFSRSEVGDPTSNPTGFMQAVKRFQEERSLFADGLLTEATLAALFTASVASQIESSIGLFPDNIATNLREDHFSQKTHKPEPVQIGKTHQRSWAPRGSRATQIAERLRTRTFACVITIHTTKIEADDAAQAQVIEEFAIGGEIALESGAEDLKVVVVGTLSKFVHCKDGTVQVDDCQNCDHDTISTQNHETRQREADLLLHISRCVLACMDIDSPPAAQPTIIVTNATKHEILTLLRPPAITLPPPATPTSPVTATTDAQARTPSNQFSLRSLFSSSTQNLATTPASPKKAQTPAPSANNGEIRLQHSVNISVRDPTTQRTYAFSGVLLNNSNTVC